MLMHFLLCVNVFIMFVLRATHSMRAAHTGSARSVAAEPRIHSARFARVMATFRRRTSDRNPTPPDPRPAQTARKGVIHFVSCHGDKCLLTPQHG